MAQAGQAAGGQRLLLSVDFEDWHQLVRRRIGEGNWSQPGPALERQTRALLSVLRELGVRATFFVLGVAARAHPGLVEEVAGEGHELACHGDAHLPVHAQTPEEFARDLRAARSTIEALTGRPPIGYRAPAFSIRRETTWAFRVLAEEGFVYDSSQHDSPMIRGRASPAVARPYQMEAGGGRTLWEFPVAVWRPGPVSVPVGGASYWALMPTPVVLRGLARAGVLPGLYLHPHELDPQRLRVTPAPADSAMQKAHGILRATQRNVSRARAAAVLRAIAERHPLIPYGEAHAELSADAAAGP